MINKRSSEACKHNLVNKVVDDDDLRDFALKNQANESTILISGATTFLGSNFLFWYIQQGGSAFILSEKGKKSPLNEIDRQLNAVSFSNQYSLPSESKRKIELFLFEKKQEISGFNYVPMRQFAHGDIHEFWCFEEGAESLYAVELAKNIGIKCFCFISTSYARGSTEVEEGIISKCKKVNLPYAILRTSFIIGRSVIKEHQQSGIYELFEILSECRGHIDAAMSVPGYVVNLMPVNQAIYDMLHLRHFSLLNGRIHILYNSSFLDLSEFLKIVTEALREVNRSIGILKPGKAKLKRKSLSHWLALHGPYLNQERFNKESLIHREFRYIDLWNHVSEWASWKRSSSISGFKMGILRNDKKMGRTVFFTAGNVNNESLFLINAYEMSVEIFFPLINALSDRYHIVTWETHGLPEIDEKIEHYENNSDQQAHIYRRLCNQLHLKDNYIVGWCSGTQIALKILANESYSVKKAVLLNNSLSMDNIGENCDTEYVSQLKALFQKIGKDPSLAEPFSRLLASKFLVKENEQSLNYMTGIFENVPRYLQYLITAPFMRAESLYRYCIISLNYWNEENTNYSLRGKIIRPVLLYATVNDHVAHSNTSRSVLENIATATLYMDEHGDHFEHFVSSGKISRIIDAFFADGENSREIE